MLASRGFHASQFGWNTFLWLLSPAEQNGEADAYVYVVRRTATNMASHEIIRLSAQGMSSIVATMRVDANNCCEKIALPERGPEKDPALHDTLQETI